MKMFTTGPMWAECNLGEYLYSATDLFSKWTEVTPKNPSDTVYLATYYDDITDFKWKTPTCDDFRQLFNADNCDIEPCKAVETGVFGLRIKSKANAGASILLPCSGHSKEQTDGDGRTVINRTFHGNYGTRDTASENDGYILHFAFSQVETVVNEVSSFSDFTPGLNGGKDYYEFLAKPKSEKYTVRAIL